MKRESLTLENRLQRFDQATVRQQKRESAARAKKTTTGFRERGWAREGIYRRGPSQ